MKAVNRIIRKVLRAAKKILRRVQLWLVPYSKRNCNICCLFCEYFDDPELGDCYEEVFGKRWDE